MSATRITLIAAGLTIAMASTLAIATPAAAARSSSIDNDDPESVAAVWNDRIRPALDQSIGWTGSVSGCDAGRISPAARAATLETVNAVRDLAGLDPVRFVDRYNRLAQHAALTMRAEERIAHDPNPTWKCYSTQAARAAATSNLGYGVAGAGAVVMYMADPGDHNVLAGHRRLILDPTADGMGSGATPVTDVLLVRGTSRRDGADPDWVTWPTAGYFPTQLEPDGRWSIAGDSAHDYDFRSAKVTVRNSAGTKLKVRVHGQHRDRSFGSDALVFEVPGVNDAVGAQVRSYSVAVTGIRRDGQRVSHRYTVRLIDAEAY